MISIFIFFLSVGRSDNMGNKGGKGLSKPISKIHVGLYGIAGDGAAHLVPENTAGAGEGVLGWGGGGRVAGLGAEVYVGDGSWNVLGDYYA